MRISLIGAGRVAHHLAHVLNAQHQIVQIYSRSLDKAQHLAAQVGAEAIAEVEHLHSDLDLVIIAVSDQAIAQVIQEVHRDLNHVLIVHTSGSTKLDVLRQYHARSGVFYPLQTFSLEREIDWSETPLLIEAALAEDQQLLMTLANSLSKRVYAYTSEQRSSLHLAAVFACNFSNYCYDMAKQLVDAQQVDFSLLYPLILETAHKAIQNAPYHMQTGPAMRGDHNILNMHQDVLAAGQQHALAEVYALMSQQILTRHQP
ncbi:Rossmann-like and DUF2520 domain-containing protein [Acinetobacter towneri]|uniref:F420-dependent NADP oxidoreductase n=1 Tax=Acinetobacter towneri TaxID=202956 RepID=A0A1E8DYC1_9GAMM|nr:Rossmann-like and DUF2520 domain-containing protein [Acinetobacter towneri]OFE42329.1 F420-dependent NADP oxidoreductase [Acinetobacter towneri]